MMERIKRNACIYILKGLSIQVRRWLQLGNQLGSVKVGERVREFLCVIDNILCRCQDPSPPVSFISGLTSPSPAITESRMRHLWNQELQSTNKDGRYFEFLQRRQLSHSSDCEWEELEVTPHENGSRSEITSKSAMPPYQQVRQVAISAWGQHFCYPSVGIEGNRCFYEAADWADHRLNRKASTFHLRSLSVLYLVTG